MNIFQKFPQGTRVVTKEEVVGFRGTRVLCRGEICVVERVFMDEDARPYFNFQGINDSFLASNFEPAESVAPEPIAA